MALEASAYPRGVYFAPPNPISGGVPVPGKPQGTVTPTALGLEYFVNLVKQSQKDYQGHNNNATKHPYHPLVRSISEQGDISPSVIEMYRLNAQAAGASLQDFKEKKPELMRELREALNKLRPYFELEKYMVEQFRKEREERMNQDPNFINPNLLEIETAAGGPSGVDAVLAGAWERFNAVCDKIIEAMIADGMDPSTWKESLKEYIELLKERPDVSGNVYRSDSQKPLDSSAVSQTGPTQV